MKIQLIQFLLAFTIFTTILKQSEGDPNLFVVGVLGAAFIGAIFFDQSNHQSRQGSSDPPAVHGGWSDWSPWSPCSVSCGEGTRNTLRRCNYPPPNHYGQPCRGEKTKQEPCNIQDCPDIDECSSDPCTNGGTCTDGDNRFTCACVPGYTGTICKTDINECNSHPCTNGGTCTDGVNRFTCTCVPGYAGTICKTDINECSPQPCDNGGTCSDGVNTFTCACIPGYTGTMCKTAQTNDREESCIQEGNLVTFDESLDNLAEYTELPPERPIAAWITLCLTVLCIISLLPFCWRMKWCRRHDIEQVDELQLALLPNDELGQVAEVNLRGQGSSATGNFGSLGGKLTIKPHGYTFSIPPGALEEDVQIELKVLTEIPNGLTLQEDELIVSNGFQCYPFGLRFKKPATLIIPHCALVSAPNKVQTKLYSWNQSGTPKRLPDSSKIICSVQEQWLEVSVSHFSGERIVLSLDCLFLDGILLSCMSFLPRVLPLSKKPLLEVRFVKKPYHQKWRDIHALNDPNFQPVKGDDDDIVLRKGTLTVACQLGEKSPTSEVHAIQYSDMRLKTKVTEYFQLDLTEESEETLVTLDVAQTSKQMIKFNTRFQGIDKETTDGNIPAPSTDKMMDRSVTEKELLKLAGCLLADSFTEVGINLGVGYTEIENIKMQHLPSLKDAYFNMLMKWKGKEDGGKMKDLDKALNESDCGGLSYKEI